MSGSSDEDVAVEEMAVECQHEHSSARLPMSQVPDEVVERAAAIFRAAGDPARLRLLERLSEGECCVSELAAESGDGMSTVSQRLRLLRAEKLVTRRRDGKHMYYALSDSHVVDLIRSAIDHAMED